MLVADDYVTTTVVRQGRYCFLAGLMQIHYKGSLPILWQQRNGTAPRPGAAGRRGRESVRTSRTRVTTAEPSRQPSFIETDCETPSPRPRTPPENRTDRSRREQIPKARVVLLIHTQRTSSRLLVDRRRAGARNESAVYRMQETLLTGATHRHGDFGPLLDSGRSV